MKESQIKHKIGFQIKVDFFSQGMEIHIWSQVNDNVQSDSPLGAKPSFTSHFGSSLLNPPRGFSWNLQNQNFRDRASMKPRESLSILFLSEFRGHSSCLCSQHPDRLDLNGQWRLKSILRSQLTIAEVKIHRFRDVDGGKVFLDGWLNPISMFFMVERA